MFKIGIECESIEAETWGVGRIVNKLLENIAARPELTNEFRFFLYFKSRIPNLPFLNNPIFIKKVIGVPSFSLYYYMLLPIKLWLEKLDLVFFPNYMLSPLFRGKSLVMLTEDIYNEIRRPDLPLRYKLAYKIFAEWWAAKHATKIMAISETSKTEVAKLFKVRPDRITVNQLGVDKPREHSAFSVQRSAETGPYTLHPVPYILYVGQAFPRRHLRETMLAFEQLTSPNPTTARPGLAIDMQGPALQLIAVGKDKYNPQIIKKLAEDINRRLGREGIPGSRSSTDVLQDKTSQAKLVELSLPGIIYKEYVPEDELSELYAGAKLLIYVSSKEAFGLPPLEALAYGIPAVVADEPINHEIYGGNVFLTKQPITTETIAEAVKDGLNNETKRQKIKESAERILEKYTWQKHTDRFLEIARSCKSQT